MLMRVRGWVVNVMRSVVRRGPARSMAVAVAVRPPFPGTLVSVSHLLPTDPRLRAEVRLVAPIGVPRRCMLRRV